MWENSENIKNGSKPSNGTDGNRSSLNREELKGGRL